MAAQIFRAALACGFLAIVGCDSGAMAGSAKQQEAVTEKVVPSPPQPTAQTSQSPQAITPTAVQNKPDTKRKHVGGEPLEWPPPLKWYAYEEGMSEAKRTGKAVLLLIYADWCPKCHLVPPQLVSPDFLKLASKFVLVRVDYEVDAPWLRTFNAKQGTYLPRILFFKPDGSLNETITSGNQRYPFFYATQSPEALQESMRRALNI